MDGEKIEQLILFVSEYNELYDIKNRNYNNTVRKENIWADIGQKLNETGDLCKQKWKTLRDGFQRASKNNLTKSGQAAKSTKKWKYWDLMLFLLPHIKGRETHSNVMVENDDEVEENSEYEINDTQDDSLNDADVINADSCGPQSNTPQSHLSSASNGKTESCVKRKLNVKSDRIESLPEILKEYVNVKQRRHTERHSSEKNSPILDFFQNMGKTAETFPPLWQARVKSKVFEIVNSTELQLLSESQVPVSQNTTSYMQNQPSTSSTHSTHFYSQRPQQMPYASRYYSNFEHHFENSQVTASSDPQVLQEL